MAKICNSRSKVYETRGVVEDEPVEHIESEGERLIKQMVQKQLDPHVNLGQELKREQNFKSVQETLPLTAYVRGETTLKEFEQTAEKAAHIEELKSFGLLNDEIQLLLDFERDILAEKYKKTDRSILSSQIESILKKIECARTESNYSLEQSSSLTNNRHERELGLCVKPESVHTKLLRFVLSCQKTKTDARPPNHPINNLKNIEKELFGHLDGAKRNRKSCINKSAKLSSRSNETVFQGFSYENGNSLWDVTKVKTCTKRKSTETSSHIYTCKPECLYTVKKGEIIPVGKRNVEEKKDKIENDIFKCSGEFVVSDMRESTIPLVPVEDISKNCLSIQEIKSISKFANYVEGNPTKVLYVKNLAGSVINDDLVSLFGHFESDTGTRIMYRLLTGRMRGQAFVTFPSTSLAKKAMNLVNGYILKGKPLILQYGKANKDDDNGNNEAGRISYENRGECFFLPYNKDDVEGNVTLRSGDKVSFQIATNQRSGNLGACHIRLENPAHPVKYQGVVCSMKESFGFIERADIVKEIFFHFSAAKGKEELRLGDDVEFTIQTRNGKEVACNITRLEPGSVVFEDVGSELIKGQVLKPLERGQQARHQTDPLPGRIKYRAPDHSEVEVPFGDKDQKGDFTLRHGDWVQFRIATDRRDQLQRATQISLLDESFLMSGERREQGVVLCLKEGFGFLRCVERDTRLFFHFNEVLDVDREINVHDEVEFTVVQDQSSFSNNRQSAIRIKHLPAGTVQFETLTEKNVTGVITKEAPLPSWGSRSPTKGSNQSPGKGDNPDVGIINYQVNGTKKTIYFHSKDCDPKNFPRIGDKVEFNITQVKRNKELLAVDIQVVAKSQNKNGLGRSSNMPVCQGFIAALKDGFGFIENITHDREVFFHFSNFEGDPSDLELGAEVEYNLGTRGSSGSCLSAENVRVLTKGTIELPAAEGDIMEGTVIRPLRSVNPDQTQYAGLIQMNTEEGEETEKKEYEFGITSLSNKRELLQTGDPVTFQLDTEGRAANVVAVRKKRRATVDAVKGLFGFLAYEVEEGKKLFFHMSEVKDATTLQPGDQVEFVLVVNQRNGKSSACNVVKVSDAPKQERPERLISRLRTISVDDSGPKLTVVRQPRGPDGTKGFSSDVRQPRAPGAVVE